MLRGRQWGTRYERMVFMFMWKPVPGRAGILPKQKHKLHREQIQRDMQRKCGCMVQEIWHFLLLTKTLATLGRLYCCTLLRNSDFGFLKTCCHRSVSITSLHSAGDWTQSSPMPEKYLTTEPHPQRAPTHPALKNSWLIYLLKELDGSKIRGCSRIYWTTEWSESYFKY